MELKKSLLIATMALFAASGLMAKNQPKKEEVPGVAAQPAEFFYTGKPYDVDLGNYVFIARNYDPEINRWTSADPSGFPDGANNRTYVSAPTYCLDIIGLYSYQYVTGNFDITATVVYSTTWFQKFFVSPQYDYLGVGPSTPVIGATEGLMGNSVNVNYTESGAGFKVTGDSAAGKTVQWLDNYSDSGVKITLTSTSPDGLTKTYTATWNYSYTVVLE